MTLKTGGFPIKSLFSIRNPSTKTEPTQEYISQLGKSARVSGRIDAVGEFLVCGSIFGRVIAERLIVAHDGYIEGDIIAKEAYINGRVNGYLYVFNVILGSSANITGHVFHHVVTVGRGAHVEGRMPWRPVNFFEILEQPSETLR